MILSSLNLDLNMAAERKGLGVKCDSCKKTMVENTILKHIGNSKSCKTSMEQDMKK